MNPKKIVPSLAITLLVISGLAAGIASGADDKTTGRVGPSLSITGNGRALTPAGRLSTVGDFPSGSALSPDGKFLWTVSSGHGRNDVQIVRVSDGAVTQTLPLPGAYGAVAFAPDGAHAYVSGESQGTSTPSGAVKASGGDAIHVYSIDGSGAATEQDPITLPVNPGGDKSWPADLAVTPDGSKLAVVEIQSRACYATPCGRGFPEGKLVVINLANTSSVAQIGMGLNSTLHGVAISPDSSHAYVTDESGGTLDVVDLGNNSVTTKIGVGGPDTGDGTGNKFSHPEGVAVSEDGAYAYVAVANRDLVAKVKLSDSSVVYTDVSRSAAWGTQPVSVTVKGNRAYVADSGEDAIAVLDTSTATPSLIGRIPTAAYPVAVAVTSDNSKLIWTAAKGLGAGANRAAGRSDHKYQGSEYFPYGNYVPAMLLGRVGVLNVPDSSALAGYTAQADAQVKPSNFTSAPPDTALKANGPIKHVFYIVRENRTYDQIFGTDTRGDGDPTLELFDKNGVSGVTGGVTPNAHALAARFPLLDHFYANSEVSVDGHIITSQGTSIDYSQRALHSNYSNRGRAFDFIYPISFTPKVSIFDQAVRQGVSAINYGENESGTSVGTSGDNGRSTFKAAQAMYDQQYPQTFGCALPIKSGTTFLTSPYCTTDSSASGRKITAFGQTLYHSRYDYWNAKFQAQVASNTVPALTYLTLPNDHTNGVNPGIPTPTAMVADNDYGLGQIVSAISKSSIWSSSAIFVIEDDSQDGADHVDAHRMPAFVISPWAKKNAVVHTRYDQDSALRSAMLLLGMQPLTLADAFATPMYDAFMRTTDAPQTATYTAIKPSYSLTKTSSSTQLRQAGALAAQLPFQTLDQVPQQLFDQVLYRSVYGPSRPVPPPGPNASPIEVARAQGALRALAAHRNVARYLRATTPVRAIFDNTKKVAGLKAAKDD